MRVSAYAAPATSNNRDRHEKLAELVEKSFRRYPNNLPAAEEHLFQAVSKNKDLVDMIVRSVLHARLRSHAESFWNSRTASKPTISNRNPKPISAAREKAIRESRQDAAERYFNNLKLPDGRYIEEIYWRELPSLIKEFENKAQKNTILWLTISTIYEHAPSTDPNRQVKDVISKKKAREMMSKVDRRMKEIFDGQGC